MAGNARHTFNVMSIERNLRRSPMSMQLLTHGNCSRTASSIRTGDTFSPPAVIIISRTQNTCAPAANDNNKTDAMP